jgi:hypothetical protein
LQLVVDLKWQPAYDGGHDPDCSAAADETLLNVVVHGRTGDRLTPSLWPAMRAPLLRSS